MAAIFIRDLKAKTIIGTCNLERKRKQDIIINITIKYNAKKARTTDSIKHAVDYEKISRQIIKKVDNSRFFLLEKLADFVLKIVIDDKRITGAVVRIDKPKALRSAKSVAVEVMAKR